MRTNRIGIGDGGPAPEQRPKQRTSRSTKRRGKEVCKPHEPTEDETRMSTLCQAVLDNDPGENTTRLIGEIEAQAERDRHRK